MRYLSRLPVVLNYPMVAEWVDGRELNLHDFRFVTEFVLHKFGLPLGLFLVG